MVLHLERTPSPVPSIQMYSSMTASELWGTFRNLLSTLLLVIPATMRLAMITVYVVEACKRTTKVWHHWHRQRKSDIIDIENESLTSMTSTWSLLMLQKPANVQQKSDITDIDKEIIFWHHWHGHDHCWCCWSLHTESLALLTSTTRVWHHWHGHDDCWYR